MFLAHQNKSFKPSQYLILKKRTLFHNEIRQQQQQKIFKRIRQQMMMPQQLATLLKQNLCQNINRVFRYTQDKDYRQWHFKISQHIKAKPQQLQKILYGEVCSNHHQKISFFAFLLKNDENAVEFYQQNINRMMEKALSWNQQQQMSLFYIFNLMLKQKQAFVLKDSIDYLKMIKFTNFWRFQLNFYYNLLKQYDSSSDFQQYGDKIFPMEIIIKLSDNLQSTHYSIPQIQKMIEILIMFLYISHKEEISENFNLQKLYTSLQFYIGYCKEHKKLAQRALYLIYNINCDSSSQIFMTHNCFKVIIRQMRKDCHHLQLRTIMAELYMNTILKYPKDKFQSYLLGQYKNICEEIQYIVENFNYLEPISSMVSQLMCFIVQFMHSQGSEELEKLFMEYFGRSLLGVLKKYKQFEDIIDLLLKKQQI